MILHLIPIVKIIIGKIQFIGATKKGTNKEQNWENKEHNGGKKFQNGAFLGYGNSWKYLLKDQV